MNPVPVETTKAPSPGELRRVRCEIQGIVQGVGFRPFVYRLATELGLGGYVRNGPQGVEMELEGTADACQDFLEALPARLPPLARVEHWTRRDLLPVGEQAFAILESQRGEKPFTHISPDIATCPACLEELDDPKNRRYQHPFINCTHCGPRFTLITDLPYDREKTTMGVFPFCPACRLEYDSPDNRRFHAEPVACPNCGPRLALYERRSPGGAHQPTHTGLQALERAGRRLSEGAVLAVKGLGGYHLACDAEHIGAVAELRRRKHRDDKPFALMAASLEQASRYVDISPAEAELLSSPARPIVLLRKRDACPAAPGVAPGFGELGLML
ncbi:MAG: Sua5/YciO/YrdC/YwlC family protein, partial [Deltaproteobacteria bacterium]|nr:Sua5/YciO/YrdC/YwlC family protein [Deltaproteobacteria bacterium]